MRGTVTTHLLNFIAGVSSTKVASRVGKFLYWHGQLEMAEASRLWIERNTTSMICWGCAEIKSRTEDGWCKQCTDQFDATTHTQQKLIPIPEK